MKGVSDEKKRVGNNVNDFCDRRSLRMWLRFCLFRCGYNAGFKYLMNMNLFTGSIVCWRRYEIDYLETEASEAERKEALDAIELMFKTAKLK